MPIDRKCGKCFKDYTIINADTMVRGDIHSITVRCPICGKEDGEVVLPTNIPSAVCRPK